MLELVLGIQINHVNIQARPQTAVLKNNIKEPFK